MLLINVWNMQTTCSDAVFLDAERDDWCTSSLRGFKNKRVQSSYSWSSSSLNTSDVSRSLVERLPVSLNSISKRQWRNSMPKVPMKMRNNMTRAHWHRAACVWEIMMKAAPGELRAGRALIWGRIIQDLPTDPARNNIQATEHLRIKPHLIFWATHS